MSRRTAAALTAVIVVYVAAVAVFATWTTRRARSTVLAAIDSRLLVAAKSLRHMLADDFHDRAVGADSIAIDEIRRNQDELSGFAADSGFTYVYTLVEADGRFFFSAPTVTAEELLEKESWYFHPYDDVPPEFVAALGGDRPVWVSYQDQWGRFRSVAVPEVSPGGRRYLACADAAIDEVERDVVRGSLTQSLAAASFILFALPLAVFLRSLARSHTRELTEANNDLIAKHTLLEGVVAENTRLEAAIESAAELVVATDRTLAITYANSAFHHVAGFAREELLGKNLRLLAATSSLPGDASAEWEALAPGTTWSGLFSAVARDGAVLNVEATVAPISRDGRQRLGLVLVGRDVTAQLGLERQFRQAQKMEAVGVLASGIAHDFNNLLTPIVGYADLVKQVGVNDPLVADAVDQILVSARRASDLVGQILSFSRQHESGPQALDPAVVTREALRLARASIPTTIRIEHRVSDDAGCICGDPVHLTQILMNLFTNAFHAMRDAGGTLTVELGPVDLGEDDIGRFPELAPGRHVRLLVADTGHGMDEATLTKIFLPFYSTKKVGEGTGLGLSTVRGLVSRSRGAIAVSSRPGDGTTFEIMFPVSTSLPPGAEESAPHLLVGSGRVLVVDDEPAVAAFVSRALELGGYLVATETSSLLALQAFRREPDGFVLVVSDDTMPDLTGRQLAAEIRRLRPAQPVLLMSGYHQAPPEPDPDLTVVTKPFSTRELARAVRACLGGEPHRA